MFAIEAGTGGVTIRNFMTGVSLFRSAIALLVLAFLAGCAEVPVTPPTSAASVAPTPPPGYWADDGLPGAPKIVVSISEQRAYFFKGKRLIGQSTVSTGKPGHRTPTGRFDILQKRAKHFSNLYNNAPMPFMQRLTWGGIALHAGQIPGRPASHGCVRLPLEFARNLFGVTSMGGSVHILDQSPAPREALALVRGNGAYTGMGGPLEEVPAGTD